MWDKNTETRIFFIIIFLRLRSCLATRFNIAFCSIWDIHHPNMRRNPKKCCFQHFWRFLFSRLCPFWVYISTGIKIAPRVRSWNSLAFSTKNFWNPTSGSRDTSMQSQGHPYGVGVENPFPPSPSGRAWLCIDASLLPEVGFQNFLVENAREFHVLTRGAIFIPMDI